MYGGMYVNFCGSHCSLAFGALAYLIGDRESEVLVTVSYQISGHEGYKKEYNSLVTFSLQVNKTAKTFSDRSL